jgi:hypothetical protein
MFQSPLLIGNGCMANSNMKLTSRPDGNLLLGVAGILTVIGDAKTASKKWFPHIHRVFALFKRVLLGTYHGSWSAKYAALYCEEFAFRFNRRRSASRVHLFERVIEQGVRRPPASTASLDGTAQCTSFPRHLDTHIAGCKALLHTLAP